MTEKAERGTSIAHGRTEPKRKSKTSSGGFGNDGIDGCWAWVYQKKKNDSFLKAKIKSGRKSNNLVLSLILSFKFSEDDYRVEDWGRVPENSLEFTCPKALLCNLEKWALA